MGGGGQLSVNFFQKTILIDNMHEPFETKKRGKKKKRNPRFIFFKGKRRPNRTIEYQYKFEYPECSTIKTYQCI